MNTTTPTIMEAKTAVNASLYAIKQHAKWIERQLWYKPTEQECNNAWLETLKIEQEVANLKNMIDQLNAVSNNWGQPS